MFFFLAHLLLYTVSSVHVLDVVQEITNRVHVAEMLAVLVDSLQHLIKSYTNLKHTSTSSNQTNESFCNLVIYNQGFGKHLQHASSPFLLEALQERPHEVVHVQELELCLHNGLQNL